jgi:hypothetical protein
MSVEMNTPSPTLGLTIEDTANVMQAAPETVRKTQVVPSDWNITPVEGDDILAVNTNTRETFTGSVEEFNKFLRG